MERLLGSRWLMLLSGTWIQASAGSSYAFGLYSQGLKSSLGYNQQSLDTIATFKDLGANVGIVSGLLYGVFPPWSILATGAAMDFLGYLMMWFSVSRVISHVSLWRMCLYMFIAANAQTFINTGVVVASVENFPSNRGSIVGLMKGFLGLSGAILSQFYRAIYQDDPLKYILMACWLPTVMVLGLMFIIRPLPHRKEENEEALLSKFAMTAMSLAVYLGIVILLKDAISIGSTISTIICIGTIFFLGMPLVFVISAMHKVPMEYTQMAAEESPCTSTDKEDESCSLPSQRGQSLLDTILCSNFWLLFIVSACGMGSGLTAINNVSQLGSSLGYSQKNIVTFVSLLSIWNFLGRFGAGFLSDYFLHHKAIPRTTFISISLAIMAVGHLVIASALPGSLYAGSVIVGICYGSHWSLMPATTSEIFDLRHFGTLFNTIAVSSPVGSYILSVRVAGYIYDYEARKQHFGQILTIGQDESLSCTGPHCFRLAFIIMAGVCLIGSLVGLVLVRQTKSLYQELFYSFRHRQL